jgi:hypothetical protein
MLAASLGATGADTSEIRINLVAVVPATCSMGQVISSEASQSGLRVMLAGNCNTDHVVRVSLAPAVQPALGARLNGASGAPGPRNYAFVRPAYFAANSLLEIDFATPPVDQLTPNADLVVEVSPV